MSQHQISDENAFCYLAAAAAIEDVDHQLWSDELVKRARFLWTLNGGQPPTLNQVAHTVGLERAEAMLPVVFSRRRFLNELLGYRSPCHYCGSATGLAEFDFALMRVTASKQTWGGTAASVALGALTMPLVGVAKLKLPGQSFQGDALPLKLIVCQVCRKKHGNFLGLFMLNEARASHHPLWQQLQDAGFAKFFDSANMPLELQMSSTTEL